MMGFSRNLNRMKTMYKANRIKNLARDCPYLFESSYLTWKICNQSNRLKKASIKRNSGSQKVRAIVVL